MGVTYISWIFFKGCGSLFGIELQVDALELNSLVTTDFFMLKNLSRIEPGRPLALPNLANPNLLVFHCRTVGRLQTRTHALFWGFFTEKFFNMSFETMKALIMTMKLGKVGLTRYLCQNLPELLIVRTVQICSAEPTRRPCPRLQNVRSLSHTHTHIHAHL